jgi:Mg2+ and Co2+ transporter CorA
MKDEGQVLADQTKTNGINTEQLKGFVAEIEDEQAKIDEIMRNAQQACEPHVTRIKEIKREAAEAGIAKKPLAAKIRERTLRRKADACREVLSDEQRDLFDEISQKLGDLFSYADQQDREAA